jgi:hypothetical protein
MGRGHAGSHCVLTSPQCALRSREREVHPGKNGIPWDGLHASTGPHEQIADSVLIAAALITCAEQIGM